MTIPDDEIISDEEVGKQGDKTVRALRTVGGLFLIEARSTKGQRTILGAGNHPCIARMLAQKLNQDVEFNDLHKSQVVQIIFMRCRSLPAYQSISHMN